MGALRHPRGETIIVHPYETGGDDGWGNSEVTFGEDYERELVAVSPRKSMSSSDGGEGTDASRWPIFEGYDLYDTFDTPIKPYDEITVRGVRVRVAGEVERWRNPFKRGPDGSVIHAYVAKG